MMEQTDSSTSEEESFKTKRFLKAYYKNKFHKFNKPRQINIFDLDNETKTDFNINFLQENDSPTKSVSSAKDNDNSFILVPPTPPKKDVNISPKEANLKGKLAINKNQKAGGSKSRSSISGIRIMLPEENADIKEDHVFKKPQLIKINKKSIYKPRKSYFGPSQYSTPIKKVPELFNVSVISKASERSLKMIQAARKSDHNLNSKNKTDYMNKTIDNETDITTNTSIFSNSDIVINSSNISKRSSMKKANKSLAIKTNLNKTSFAIQDMSIDSSTAYPENGLNKDTIPDLDDNDNFMDHYVSKSIFIDNIKNSSYLPSIKKIIRFQSIINSPKLIRIHKRKINEKEITKYLTKYNKINKPIQDPQLSFKRKLFSKDNEFLQSDITQCLSPTTTESKSVVISSSMKIKHELPKPSLNKTTEVINASIDYELLKTSTVIENIDSSILSSHASKNIQVQDYVAESCNDNVTGLNSMAAAKNSINKNTICRSHSSEDVIDSVITETVDAGLDNGASKIFVNVDVHNSYYNSGKSTGNEDKSNASLDAENTSNFKNTCRSQFLEVVNKTKKASLNYETNLQLKSNKKFDSGINNEDPNSILQFDEYMTAISNSTHSECGNNNGSKNYETERNNSNNIDTEFSKNESPRKSYIFKSKQNLSNRLLNEANSKKTDLEEKNDAKINNNVTTNSQCNTTGETEITDNRRSSRAPKPRLQYWNRSSKVIRPIIYNPAKLQIVVDKSAPLGYYYRYDNNQKLQCNISMARASNNNNSREKAKTNFIKLLEEHNVDRHTIWTALRKEIKSDPRYKAVENCILCMDYFNEYLYSQLKNSKTNIKKENVIKKPKTPDKGNGKSDIADPEPLLENHSSFENVQQFRLLLEYINNIENQTWSTVKRKLQKDERWKLVENIPPEKQKSIFNDYVKTIISQHLDKFRELLEELCQIELITSWRYITKLMRKDSRFSEFKPNELYKATFLEFVEKKSVQLKLSFKQVLKDCRKITPKTFSLIKKRHTYLTELEDIFKNDEIYIALNQLEDERRKIIIDYIKEISGN